MEPGTPGAVPGTGVWGKMGMAEEEEKGPMSEENLASGEVLTPYKSLRWEEAGP